MKTPRRCRGLGTFLNSLDDVTMRSMMAHFCVFLMLWFLFREISSKRELKITKSNNGPRKKWSTEVQNVNAKNSTVEEKKERKRRISWVEMRSYTKSPTKWNCVDHIHSRQIGLTQSTNFQVSKNSHLFVIRGSTGSCGVGFCKSRDAH